MAHLWFRGDESLWAVIPLDGRAVDISVQPPRVLAAEFELGEDRPAVIMRAVAGDSPVWVLLAAADSDVRINGFAPVAGVRVLQDRDEIRAFPSDALFFSTETPAHVEAFAATERAIFCGRCRQPIQDGGLAVRCPNCGIWYHQGEQLPCWTYAATCAFCPQSTTLDAGFTWTPEV